MPDKLCFVRAFFARAHICPDLHNKTAGFCLSFASAEKGVPESDGAGHSKRPAGRNTAAADNPAAADMAAAEDNSAAAAEDMLPAEVQVAGAGVVAAEQVLPRFAQPQVSAAEQAAEAVLLPGLFFVAFRL